MSFLMLEHPWSTGHGSICISIQYIFPRCSIPFVYLETELNATGEYFCMFNHLWDIGDGPICIVTFRRFSCSQFEDYLVWLVRNWAKRNISHSTFWCTIHPFSVPSCLFQIDTCYNLKNHFIWWWTSGATWQYILYYRYWYQAKYSSCLYGAKIAIFPCPQHRVVWSLALKNKDGILQTELPCCFMSSRVQTTCSFIALPVADNSEIYRAKWRCPLNRFNFRYRHIVTDLLCTYV